VTKFYPRGDLEKYIKYYVNNTTRRYSENHLQWVAYALLQIITSVEHLHALDFIHRDLQPENLLVADNGTFIFYLGDIILSDFGLVAKNNVIDSSLCGTL
jgi:serine/threonine protein kinase